MEKEQIFEGIKEKGIYDFISQEGYKLSKDEIITILKEVDFKLYNLSNSMDLTDNNERGITYKRQVENIIEELEERL